MFEIRVLSKEDIMNTLKISEVIEVVESVYKLKSNNMTDTWPTVFYEFESGKSDLDIKSGYLISKKIFGHKTVTWFGDNVQKNLPTLTGMISVFDAETGILKGITDASYITGIRTGVVGALGAKYLAKENAENLLIVGAGNQAIFQIAGVLTLIPSIKRINIAASNFENAKIFAETISYRLKNEFDINAEHIVFEPVKNLEIGVKESHIIITITPSRHPIIKKEWVQKGTHISCIGADMIGKQELESEILSSALLFVDDMEHCSSVGEIELPLKQGVINKEHIIGEIGDLILNKVSGRRNNEQITVFDATGMAILDIATADLALNIAEKSKIGSKTKI